MIRLTHIDGKLPNLALMKLAHWYTSQGDEVVLARTPSPSMFEPEYRKVYGSAIFRWSAPVVERLRAAYPEVIVGGTGTGDYHTVEDIIEAEEYEHYDYSLYPTYPFSLGFTQRGCRLNCGFCVVPKKEGKPRSVNTIWDIWRPETARCIVLLDNDFFGQDQEHWEARLTEIREGGFKVSFNQGINVRMITPESAAAVASVRYYDDQFRTRTLYTAWDNIGQEKVFFRALDMLNDAGVPASHLRVYMLIGYAPDETMERIIYRYRRLKEAGCEPFPMVYDNVDSNLKRFQRWAIRRYEQAGISWNEYGGRRQSLAVRRGRMPLSKDGISL